MQNRAWHRRQVDKRRQLKLQSFPHLHRGRGGDGMDRRAAVTSHHKTCTFSSFSSHHILLNPFVFAFRRSMHQSCNLWRLVNVSYCLIRNT